MPGRIGHHLNKFLPNLITGQIGWKSIESTRQYEADDAQFDQASS